MMGYFANVKKSFKFKHFINYIAVALALVIAIVLNNTVGLSRSTLSLFCMISYYVILAVSLNLVVGFLGELSLGHAGFMCVGAYIGCLFINIFKPYFKDTYLILLIIAMLIGGLCAAVFGLLIGIPALRLKGDYLAIVTLAFGEIVRTVFNNLELFGGASGLQTNRYESKYLFIVGFVAILVTLIISQNLIRSKHGRAITAIRDNEIAAKAMGINITFYKLLVFVIAAFFAGVAGVIYGNSYGMIKQNNFDYNFSIEILVMVVLGGMGSINGSIIAATLLTVVNTLLKSSLTGKLAAVKTLVYALILIIAVLYNNAPVFAKLREKVSIDALRRKFAKSPEVVTDDGAEWSRIESKIKMDEVLSVEATARKEDGPDKPEKKKGGK